MPICPVDMYQGYTDECLSCCRKTECMLVMILNKVEKLEAFLNTQDAIGAIQEK